jgi:cell shape-determining protein MreC
MKRTFLAKRNALLSSTSVSWGAFALAGAIFVLLIRLLAPNIFWYAFTPVFRGADMLATQSHRILSSFNNTANLTLQNEQLVNENAALANENQTLLQKATSLEELLGFSSSGQTTRGIVAGVTARPPTSPYDTLVLSPGSNAGITVGQGAFGRGGVPLGVVSAVSADFSRVTLFSAPNMTVQGWVGRTHIPLLIQGSGGGVMRASLSRSAGVAVGDAVFTSGPGLLPIGSVVRVDSDPSSPIVTLQIQLTLNLFSITWVELRDMSTAFSKSLSCATSTLL